MMLPLRGTRHAESPRRPWTEGLGRTHKAGAGSRAGLVHAGHSLSRSGLPLFQFRQPLGQQALQALERL